MTSPWVLQLRKGSFRGIPFEIDSHEFTGGRRIADHLFPYKPLAYTEDLGLKQRTFTINAFIIGSNYFGARNRLIDALESEAGPGILVHPYLNGNKTVDAESFSVRETTQEGGLVTINITFKETGTVPQPVGIADLQSQVEGYASKLQAFASSDFLDFNINGSPSFVSASALSMINSTSLILSKATNGIPSESTELSNFNYAVRNLKGNATALAKKPGTLASNLIATFKSLTSVLNLDGLLPENDNGIAVKKPNQALLDAQQGAIKRGAFQGLIEFYKTLPVTFNTTQSRKLQLKNQALYSRLVTLSALGELAIVSTQTDYGSPAEALAQRDAIVAALDVILFDDTLSDNTYGAIQDLQAGVSQAIPDPDGETPRISLVPLFQVMPSLPILYDLYEAIDLENDLILRNGLVHPGFISPAKPLEVIAGA